MKKRPRDLSDKDLLIACRYSLLQRFLKKYGLSIFLGLSIGIGLSLTVFCAIALSDELGLFDPERELVSRVWHFFPVSVSIIFMFCVFTVLAAVPIVWIGALIFSRNIDLKFEAYRRFLHIYGRCDPATIERLTANSGPFDWFVGIYKYDVEHPIYISQGLDNERVPNRHLTPITTTVISIKDLEEEPTAALHFWTYPESIDFGKAGAEQKIKHTGRSIDPSSINKLQTVLNRLHNHPLTNDNRGDRDDIVYILRVINHDLEIEQLAECTIPAWWADVEVSLNCLPTSSVLLNRVLRIARDLSTTNIDEAVNVVGGT